MLSKPLFGDKHKRYTLIFLCTYLIVSASTIVEQLLLRQLDNIIYHVITLCYVGLTFVLLFVFKNRSRQIFIFSFLLFSILLIIVKDIGDNSGVMMFLLFFCIGVQNKYFTLHKGWCFITPVVVVIAITINSGLNGGSAATITKALTMCVSTTYIYLNEFKILKKEDASWIMLGLKPIEKDYINLLYKELTIQELSVHFGCSESYIKKVVYALRRKVGVKTDIGLALWAKESKLI